MTDATPSPDETALDDLGSTDTTADGRPDAADAAIEAAKEATPDDDPAKTQSPTDAQVTGTQS